MCINTRLQWEYSPNKYMLITFYGSSKSWLTFHVISVRRVSWSPFISITLQTWSDLHVVLSPCPLPSSIDPSLSSASSLFFTLPILLLSIVSSSDSLSSHSPIFQLVCSLLSAVVSSLVLPDIVAQTLVSLIALVWACSHVAGTFQSIRADITVLFLLLGFIFYWSADWSLISHLFQTGKRRWEDVAACPSFMSFDHRAKALSPSFTADSAFAVSFCGI